MIFSDVGRSMSAIQAPIMSCSLLEKRAHLVLSEARLSIGGSNNVGLVFLGMTYFSKIVWGKVRAASVISVGILYTGKLKILTGSKWSKLVGVSSEKIL